MYWYLLKIKLMFVYFSLVECMLYSTGMGKKSSGGEGMECQQPFSPKKGVLSIKGPIFSYFFNINLCMNSPVTPILSKHYMYTCMR